MSTSTTSIVFTDIVGSTALRARIGEEVADRLFRDHERSLGQVVAAGSGRVVKTGGDGLMAAFDSATDAVLAAVAIQQRIAQSFPELSIRVGIATGDVSWEDDDCFGMPVVTAARLQAKANGGQIIASALVCLLAGERSGATFRALGSFELSGLNAPVEAFEIDWSPIAEALPNDGFAPRLPGALAVEPAFGFVGRETEWSELAAAWQRAVEGERRIVLIGGEAGAGKTRLAFEFARRCAEQGAAVVLGVCDAELGLPSQPWVQVLEQLIRALPVEVMQGFGDEISEISALVPEFDRFASETRRSRTVDPQTEQYRLFQAVASFLAAVAAVRPMVVIADDLHWADSQTLALLRHIARSAEPARLLIIGTFRDTDDEITDPLASCLADLRRVDAVGRLRLAGLDRAHITRFLAELIGHELDEGLLALSRALADRSGGNAFYVSELWRHVVSNGTVVCVNGTWVVHDGKGAIGGVPDSVREVVTHRLDRLSPAARSLIEVAAISGLRVEFPVLVHATGLAKDDVGSILDELLRSKFLVEIEGAGLPSFEFAHSIVRETVERTVTSTSRARVHRSLGLALEVVYQTDRRPVLADLARHFVAAARLGTEEKALQYCRLAAAQAVRSGAHDAACVHLSLARELAVADSEEAIEVLLDLGTANSRAGDIGQSVEILASAFDAARRTGRVEQAGRAALGLGESYALSGAQSEAPVEVTRAALALFEPDDSPTRLRLQASLARALALAGGQGDEARRAADEAVAAARLHGDDELVLNALLCRNHTVQHDALACFNNAAEACEISASLGDAWSYCYARHTLARALLFFGRVEESAAVARDLAVVTKRERFVRFGHYAANHEVLLALIAGRFGEAERLANEVHEFGLANGIESADGVYGVHMYAIRREQGRLREVASVVRLVAADDSGEPMWRPGLVALYADIGMFDQARQQFADLALNQFAVIPRDSMWPSCLTFLAEACITLGDVDRAGMLYEELKPFAGLTLMAAFTVNFGPAERLMGGLAALLGDRVAAERHFRAALDLAERSGSPVWRAHVQADWVAVLGDRDGMLAAAHTTAVALGMIGLAERTVPGSRPVNRPEPTYPLGLSTREVGVLRLIATGCSNREIGEQLFISQNTVANHVRSILQKTGCVNRADAAAYATRNGLTSSQI
jgi:DNA-binding CsgD family transcriptional regulator/tetratricopeptide (TPR) repeat protein